MQQEPVLPALRQDLDVAQAGHNADGSARFVVEDRLRGRFIALGEEAANVLRHWQPVTPSRLAQLLNENGLRAPAPDELIAFAAFLHANQMTLSPPDGDAARYFAQPNTLAAHPFSRMFSTALFVRWPLLDPGPLLKLLSPLFRLMVTRAFLLALCAMLVLDLWLVMQNWESFLTAFAGWHSLEGVLMLGVGLFLLKAIHELGHALVAVRYGVPVPAAGIAVMMMTPMLYTDTSASWRLDDPKKRLAIDAAGMAAEIVVAVFATFLWAVLEDGPLRALMFVMATTAWIMSVVVNLNPLMKFDGYHMLCSITGYENLQERAFALFRWRLRRLLFAVAARPPEILPPAVHRWFLWYAVVALVYRIILQLGIALMIYWLLPKAIGLPLAAFALLLSLLAPLAEEVASWWKDRQRLAATARSKATLLALLGVLALMLAPLPATIRIPAVLMSRDEFRLFTPDAGQAVTVNLEPGRRVSKGEILLELKSDEIDSALKLAQIMRDKVAARLRRAAADRQDLALSRVLGGELKAAEAEIAGLLTRRNALVIRAPINGVIGESLWPARAGQWIGANVLVALVHEPSAIRAEGLLSEQDARHLAPGSDGRFFADNLAIAPMSVSVLKISAVPAASLAFAELADVEGGLVPLEPTGGADSEGVPHGSWFPVELATPPGVALAGATTLRGVAVIRSGRQSLLSGLARRLAAVVVRESGL